ncbi:MAG: hypothetical protein AB7H70_14625 [Rhodospirillaceae bacterium]
MAARFSVHIRGDGIAALTCAHLLTRADIGVSMEALARGRVPALLLSAQAMHLLGDIFARKDLFTGLHRIHTRRVAWGAQGETLAIPHAGVVVSEQAFIGRLPTPQTSAQPGAFTIHAVKPLPDAAQHLRFGTQTAASLAVTLRSSADAGACYVEALDDGWLFLIPTSAAEGRLFAVGTDAGTLLGASRLIAPAIDTLAATGAFETSPAIAQPLCAPAWLACGSAAMTFDPICGDGTATAAREAILASAALAAVARGEAPEPLLLHYRSLLTGSMRRHLALCLEFYTSGGTGPWWAEQCALLRQGHDWCTAQLALTPEPRYRLHDFDLVSIETQSPS